MKISVIFQLENAASRAARVIEVCSDNTVVGVKFKIFKDFGVAVHRQRLIWKGELLRGGKTLALHGIVDGSTLQMLEIAPISRIQVKTLTGKVFALPVGEFNTIYQLKSKIEASQGIPSSEQRLSRLGRELENGRSLLHYKLNNNTVVVLVIVRGPTSTFDQCSQQVDQ